MRTNGSIDEARSDGYGPRDRTAPDLIHSDDQPGAAGVQRRLDLKGRFSNSHS
jgi:hypothetical protein